MVVYLTGLDKLGASFRNGYFAEDWPGDVRLPFTLIITSLKETPPHTKTS